MQSSQVAKRRGKGIATSFLQLTKTCQPCQKLDLSLSLQGDRLVFVTGGQHLLSEWVRIVDTGTEDILLLQMGMNL